MDTKGSEVSSIGEEERTKRKRNERKVEGVRLTSSNMFALKL
jgi:hypothetical protein